MCLSEISFLAKLKCPNPDYNSQISFDKFYENSGSGASIYEHNDSSMFARLLVATGGFFIGIAVCALRSHIGCCAAEAPASAEEVEAEAGVSAV